MRKSKSPIHHKLLAALLWLLLTTPGTWAQGGAGLARPPAQGSPPQPAGAVLISNKIQFHGQVPDTQTNYRADPLDVCPNVVDPVTHGIQSQPYQFEFESNCVGNSNSTDCRFRPNFIWTIHYYTEAGGEFTQQWQDVTAGDFSKIRLYLYDRVPYSSGPATPTNRQATKAGGNTNFSAVPYPNLGCLSAPVNTAQAGDPITSVWLECTGYSCGFSEGDDTDNIHIRYYGRRPAAIAVNGPSPLCRNIIYPISVSPVLGATNYLWYTSGLNGAVIYGVNGTNAMLDVSGVPAGVTSITLRVAAQDNAHCGGITSAVRELVVNVAAAAAAPQNIQLSNGRCPTTGPTDLKNLLVDQVAQATSYHWELINNTAGATFVNGGGGTVCDYCNLNESIRTPNSGQFTAVVSARVKGCEGITATASQSFTINGSVPNQISNVDFPNGLCLGGNYFPLLLHNPDAGVLYSMSVVNVMPNSASINFIQNPGGQPSGQIRIQNGTPTGFDVNVFGVGACPPAAVVNFPLIHVSMGPGYCYQSSVGGGGGSGPQQRTATTTLYPNPTTGLVSVQAGESVRYEWVKVTDMQGRLVLEQHAAEGKEGVLRFDLSHVPTGVYEVLLFDGKKLTQKRLSRE